MGPLSPGSKLSPRLEKQSHIGVYRCGSPMVGYVIGQPLWLLQRQLGE